MKKQISRYFVLLVAVVGVGLMNMACRPAAKDPPFAGVVPRSDVNTSALTLAPEHPLVQMGVKELWAKTSGKTADGNRVVVAMIGTGVDYNIADFREALWINPGELQNEFQNDLYDNDHNGYPDDLFGYDFHSGDGLPFDWHGHDTFTASAILGAAKASAKVIGAAPNASLMALRYLGSDGRGNGFDAAFALEYAVDNGAKIVYFNWPQGGFSASQTRYLLQMAKYAGERNVLIVTPAGNTKNQDVPAFLKAMTALENVVVVSGMGKDGRLSRTTNYGRDLSTTAAPADGSFGYAPGGEVTDELKTSSVAAAYVTGVAALIATLPGYGSALKIKTAILNNISANRLDEPFEVLSEGMVSVAGLSKP